MRTANKFSTFEAKNEELENLLEMKERELLEERMRRDEAENELKRISDEQEDQRLKTELEAKYGLNNKSALDDFDDSKSKLENKTESTYYIDSQNLGKDSGFGNIYGKLSSELSNLRNEINNLKSERSHGEANKKAAFGHSRKMNGSASDQYYDLNVRKNKAEYKQQLSHEAMMNLRHSNYGSNYSEIDKLNDLERKLDQRQNFVIASHDDSDDMMSYNESETENVRSETKYNFYSHSENQSPNQESYRPHQVKKSSKDNVFWNIANTLNIDPSGKPVDNLKKLVPNLNMDKLHN